jgi:hypothetical protein
MGLRRKEFCLCLFNASFLDFRYPGRLYLWLFGFHVCVAVYISSRVRACCGLYISRFMLTLQDNKQKKEEPTNQHGSK